MINNCPVCGKGFYVLYPDLWRFKRKNQYLCSWKCIRQFDRKEEEKVNERVVTKRTRMSRDDMAEAVRMYKEGDPGLNQYLTDHGITQIAKWKKNAKARYGAPQPPTLGDAMAGMKDAADKFFKELEVMGLDIADEDSRTKIPENAIPVPPPIEYKVTGISTAVGDFQYFKKAGYIDWTTLTGETVSMSLEEWNELMKIWPFVLKVLEVEPDV